MILCLKQLNVVETNQCVCLSHVGAEKKNFTGVKYQVREFTLCPV